MKVIQLMIPSSLDIDFTDFYFTQKLRPAVKFFLILLIELIFIL